ncbi:MAG: glycosyltransferase [Chloroflexi bacterium]|nr:glycosyltransferase [Chloroflexota bacterium]
MSKQPLVSIVTPSMNQRQFIGFALQSVAAQDYAAIEHIIIDGGSTDGSVQAIEHYAQTSPHRVKWISEQDNGQADAINKGFRMAAGDIVAWINSDDAYLFRSTLSEVVKAFDRLPGADIVYGDVVVISSDNRVLKAQCIPSFSYQYLLRGCYLAQPAVFFRRTVIETDRLDASISIALDYDLWLRLGRRYRFVHMPKLWAVDRNQLDRKILARRAELIQERESLMQQYGQAFGSRYQFERLGDKVTRGFPSRVQGLLALRRLHHTRPGAFALSLQFDPLPITIYRQMWKKNKDLR